MSGSLDEVYFEWLYSTLGPRSLRDPRRTYWQLAAQMHQTEFTWFIFNDDNRASDGQELREEFLRESGYDASERWLHAPCSVLEMLIALARRVAFESYAESTDWIHVFLRNLEVYRFVDDVYDDHVADEVSVILRKLVQRKYGVDGRGGIFPLRMPNADQRKVEIWYQMSTYLLEGDSVANGP